jgi:hypothetical protein
MACDTILDILTQESGRFGPEVYNRVFATSPWVGLVNRGRFPSEMGSQISLLTYERSVPTDAVPEWTAITPSEEAEGGSCLPAAKKIAIGSRTRNYALYRRVLEGPDFCVEDLRFKFQLRNQLERILAVLAEYSRNEWEIRYRHDYWFNVSNRTVVDANVYTTSTLTDEGPNYDLPAACPTSILTQGVLNWSKMKMLRDGAIASALGRENGGAVLTLVCSAETSDRLIFDNDDIRQDLRWGKPSELLAAYGVERSYRGFYHLIDPYPMRFTCDGGAFTEVPAFVDAAATKGTKSVVNSSWETAPYEASFVFDPQVFHSLIPEPITNPAPNFKFDPVTYLGDWRLKNILDRVCNPDGTIVYHRGILAEGAMPVHPERGWMYIHLRCDPAPNLVTECT